MSSITNVNNKAIVEKKENVAEEEPKQVEKTGGPLDANMSQLIAKIDKMIVEKRHEYHIKFPNAKKTVPNCPPHVVATSVLPPTDIREPIHPLCRSDLEALNCKQGRAAYLCDFVIDEFFATRTFSSRQYSAVNSTDFIREKPENTAKKIETLLVQGFAFVLLPVELNDHWIVLLIGKNKCQVYNPLRPHVPTAVHNFCETLSLLMPSFASSPSAFKTLPRQTDSVSCGPMVCMFLEELVSGKIVKWNQKKADEDLVGWRESYLQELQSYTAYWEKADTPIPNSTTDAAAEAQKELMARVWKFVVKNIDDNFPQLTFWERCQAELCFTEPIEHVWKMFAESFEEEWKSLNLPREPKKQIYLLFRAEVDKQTLENADRCEHVTHRRRRVHRVKPSKNELVKEDVDVESTGKEAEERVGEPKAKKQRLELQVVILKVRLGRSRDDPNNWLRKAFRALRLNDFEASLITSTPENNDCYRNAPGFIASFDVSCPSTIEKLIEHMKTHNIHSDVFMLPYLGPDHFIIWIFLCFVSHELGSERQVNVFHEVLWGDIDEAIGWMVRVVKQMHAMGLEPKLQDAVKKIDRNRQGRLREMCAKEGIAISTSQ